MDVTNPPTSQHITSKTLYRWQPASLEDHLRALKPQWYGKALEISSEALGANASFVNYVRHHRFLDPCTGLPVEIVEKSIRKVAFIGSQEARFHRSEGMLAGSTHFLYPSCLGVIETPWESLIFTEFVRGKPPHMHAIAKQLALGIAELEGLSHSYLHSQPWTKALLLWSMDFYRPWFLLRPRFNFARCLPSLERLGLEDDRFAGLAERFKAFVPLTRKLAARARRSSRCISHMDYLRKNLFVDKGQLHLIDWSEVKVGRVGFDGGAYLGSLFRRKDMKVFLAAQAEFIEAYRAALPERFDAEQALENLRYMFLLTALFHCLRPETVAEYRERDRMALLQEKYTYLLGLMEGTQIGDHG
ncbi:phosphotransferase [Pseudomonas putida]|uniref:phosphotransferase family protein n=1 Tax=unclassified Pseudomonas TaxID=196821 RepID=UPI002557B602|nr:phosphotransferase [Pseudomonas sp. M2(2023)]MDY4312254.1 phosphotransferase [Pseudomonas putida]MDY4322540.1 phosphotransferase [Pseudomonas putida]MDY4355930.1 phosphotransferase [Pseudomonas putida]WIV25317.1 phosphotransferase [Pseudomonas sp. M2(2023)]